MSAHEPFSVRRARPEDAAPILECLRAAFEPYRELYTPGAFEDTVLTPGTVGERLATMAVFVAATASGEVVGTVACHLVGAGAGHLRGWRSARAGRAAAWRRGCSGPPSRTSAARGAAGSAWTRQGRSPAPSASTRRTAFAPRAGWATSSGWSCSSTSRPWGRPTW